MKTGIGTRIPSFIIAVLFLAACLIGPAGYKAYAASVGPEILITEVMPMSQSGDDIYEYIEIYNNSNDSINLKDYKLPLQNVDFTVSKVIPSKGVLVICTRSNTTLAGFNEFYGTSLTPDKFITLPSLQDILDNTRAESIIIAGDNNLVVVEAGYGEGDIEAKKSVNYKYPASGFEMVKVGVKQAPTPGNVEAAQVPDSGVKVTGVTLDKTTANLEIGKVMVLEARIRPANAADKNVEWSSSKADIASIDENGVVSALKEGQSIITVKTVDGGYTASCLVTVTDKPEDNEGTGGFRLNKSFLSLKVSNSHRLVPIFISADIKSAKITWKSDNKDIAAVSPSGWVMGLKEGYTVITATASTKDGEYSNSCLVYVRKHDNGKSKWNGSENIKGKGALK